MGAVSATFVKADVLNDKRVVVADVVLSASYATGGDSLALGNLGLREIDAIFIHGGVLAPSQALTSKAFTPNGHGLQLVLAGTTTVPLLKAFHGTTSEVANATDLSAVPAVRVEFRGS